MQGHPLFQVFADSAVDRLSGEFRTPLVFGADMNHEQMEERWVLAPLSELDFLLPESLKIMVSRELDGGTKRSRALDIDFSGHVASTCATGYLGQELKRSFPSPKIGHVQSDVRVDDAHQSDVWEIEPLGDHLCADQDINFTGSKRLQNRTIRIFPRHRIGVHSCNRCRRKKLLHCTLDFLGSVACVTNGGVGTFRAVSRSQRDMAAQVAFEPIFTQMKGERDAAIRAFTDEAALIANQGSGEAAPVQE